MSRFNVLFLRFNNLSGDSRLLKEVHAVGNFASRIVVYGLRQFEEMSISSYEGVKFKSEYIKDRRAGGKFSKLLNLIEFNIKTALYIIHHHKDIDIIHFSDLETAALPFWIAYLYKIKTVYDIYDYYADTRTFSNFVRKIIVAFDTAIINRADDVIVCSDERIEQIQPAHPKKISVIYNSPMAYDVHTSNIARRGRQSPFRIVYVGGLWPYRMITELLSVVETDVRLSLTIAGEGQLKEQVTAAASRCKRIKFLGEIPYSKVSEIESEADLMIALYDPVILNHRYASPNKFFEAFMLGKPLVMVNNSGMSNWISKVSCGATVDVSKVSLQEGFDKIIAMKADWANISERMQQTFQKNFDWSIMEKRLKNIYQSL